MPNKNKFAKKGEKQESGPTFKWPLMKYGRWNTESNRYEFEYDIYITPEEEMTLQVRDGKIMVCRSDKVVETCNINAWFLRGFHNDESLVFVYRVNNRFRKYRVNLTTTADLMKCVRCLREQDLLIHISMDSRIAQVAVKLASVWQLGGLTVQNFIDMLMEDQNFFDNLDDIMEIILENTDLKTSQVIVSAIYEATNKQ